MDSGQSIVKRIKGHISTALPNRDWVHYSFHYLSEGLFLLLENTGTKRALARHSSGHAKAQIYADATIKKAHL
jgi:hypothetical protein